MATTFRYIETGAMVRDGATYGPISVKREPLTYEPHTQVSFFQDLATAQLRPGEADQARARLAAHRHELEVERRVNPRAVLGQGGEFDPPLWAITQFATAARSGRVIADLVRNLELPAGVNSVHVPLLTTSANAAVQSADGTQAPSVDQVTADVAGNTRVTTIAGDVDVSQQLFDWVPTPGYDGIVYVDLMRTYNQTLEQQLTFGTGLAGQQTGVTQITGRQTDISGSGVSVTQATGVPQIKPLIGQAMAVIGNNRKLQADNMVLAPRRWAWIVSDVSEVPIVQTIPFDWDAFPMVGADQAVKTTAMGIAGLPAWQSGACMSGAATATDVAVVFRSTDMLLYESTPKFATMPNPLSGTLSIRLQLRKYVAFPILRPGGICCVTALPAPTAFGA